MNILSSTLALVCSRLSWCQARIAFPRTSAKPDIEDQSPSNVGCRLVYTGKQMYTHWQGPGNYILHLVQPTKVSFHFRAMKTDKVLRCYNLTTVKFHSGNLQRKPHSYCYHSTISVCNLIDYMWKIEPVVLNTIWTHRIS